MAPGPGGVEMAAMVSRSKDETSRFRQRNTFRQNWNQFLQNVPLYLFGEYLPLTGVMETKNPGELYFS